MLVFFYAKKKKVGKKKLIYGSFTETGDEISCGVIFKCQNRESPLAFGGVKLSLQALG